MAQGDSIVSICNIALVALGADPITSLTDAKKTATLCAMRYDDTRRSILRSNPWNCNTTRAQLAADPTAPAFGFGNRYRLPPDFMRMLDLPDNEEAEWVIEGNYLLTDETAPLNVLYGRDLQDPTLFDPLLVQCIAYALALELAQPLAQKLLPQIEKMLSGKMEMARLVGSQENWSREWDVDVLLRARR